jgi:hypothetical protein
MNRRRVQPVLAACLIGLAGLGSAQADTLTEDFEAAFPAWESGWFGVHSDARNYYCDGTRGCAFRGNNPDGLWLAGSTAPGADPVLILVSFDPTFAGSLLSLTIDVAGYSASNLTATDKNGVVIFNQTVATTAGATTDPGIYTTYTITSNNGIGSFGFTGLAAGFTSIDNLVATTAPIPEPASVALMLAGLAAVGAAARRHKSSAA